MKEITKKSRRIPSILLVFGGFFLFFLITKALKNDN